jgi:hypothetical protein
MPIRMRDDVDVPITRSTGDKAVEVNAIYMKPAGQ